MELDVFLDDTSNCWRNIENLCTVTLREYENVELTRVQRTSYTNPVMNTTSHIPDIWRRPGDITDKAKNILNINCFSNKTIFGFLTLMDSEVESTGVCKWCCGASRSAGTTAPPNPFLLTMCKLISTRTCFSIRGLTYVFSSLYPVKIAGRVLFSFLTRLYTLARDDV